MSSKEVIKCPPAEFPEYAFIGRSNVGKSSLINMITNKKELAHTSSTPGKTQLINHFIINNNWYLVDLPGYGYASVNKSQKKEFSQLISSYILRRPNLMCVFVLVDSRHELQENDADFLMWLGEKKIPFVLVFTKADKNKSAVLEKNIENYKKALLENWEEMPQYFLTSAEEKTGQKEILDFIGSNNKNFTLSQKK